MFGWSGLVWFGSVRFALMIEGLGTGPAGQLDYGCHELALVMVMNGEGMTMWIGYVVSSGSQLGEPLG